ncbi:hypothetical protein AU190_03440 [Mycolicibacterium acapulense]|nr:hypothetical protein AU189_02930 [Mycolicibacterium acapulense]KUI07600.1 hypothetical protein AU190_03440 [Mycolicibacterium acapulense]
MGTNFTSWIGKVPHTALKAAKRLPAIGLAIEIWSGPVIEPYRTSTDSAATLDTVFSREDALEKLPANDFELGTPESPWYGLEGYDSA